MNQLRANLSAHSVEEGWIDLNYVFMLSRAVVIILIIYWPRWHDMSNVPQKCSPTRFMKICPDVSYLLSLTWTQSLTIAKLTQEQWHPCHCVKLRVADQTVRYELGVRTCWYDTMQSGSRSNQCLTTACRSYFYLSCIVRHLWRALLAVWPWGQQGGFVTRETTLQLQSLCTSRNIWRGLWKPDDSL